MNTSSRFLTPIEYLLLSGGYGFVLNQQNNSNQFEKTYEIHGDCFYLFFCRLKRKLEVVEKEDVVVRREEIWGYLDKIKALLIAVLAGTRFKRPENYRTLCIESQYVDRNYWKAQNRSSVVFLNTKSLNTRNSSDERFAFQLFDFPIKATDLNKCDSNTKSFDFITIDFISTDFYSVSCCDHLFGDILRFSNTDTRIVCFFDEQKFKVEAKKKIKKETYISLHETKYDSESAFTSETFLKLAVEHKLSPVMGAYGFPMGRYLSSLDCEKAFKHFDINNSLIRHYIKDEGQRDLLAEYSMIVFERP